MPHPNPTLSELGRLRLARVIVDQAGRRLGRPSGSRSAGRPPTAGLPVTGTRGRPGWLTGPDRSAATSTAILGPWSTSTSSSWATSPPGGHRFLGRAAGMGNHQADRSGAQRSRHPNRGKATASSMPPLMTTPASPMPRSTRCDQPDRGRVPPAGQAWVATHGLVIQRLLTDNASGHRSRPWAQACRRLGSIAKRTRPSRPRPTARSKGRTVQPHPAGGWAYRRR